MPSCSSSSSSSTVSSPPSNASSPPGRPASFPRPHRRALTPQRTRANEHQPPFQPTAPRRAHRSTWLATALPNPSPRPPTHDPPHPPARHHPAPRRRIAPAASHPPSRTHQRPDLPGAFHAHRPAPRHMPYLLQFRIIAPWHPPKPGRPPPRLLGLTHLVYGHGGGLDRFERASAADNPRSVRGINE